MLTKLKLARPHGLPWCISIKATSCEYKAPPRSLKKDFFGLTVSQVTVLKVAQAGANFSQNDLSVECPQAPWAVANAITVGPAHLRGAEQDRYKPRSFQAFTRGWCLNEVE